MCSPACGKSVLAGSPQRPSNCLLCRLSSVHHFVTQAVLLGNMPCMHMQSALARQMPGCSTTGRSNTQLQISRLSHRAFQPQAARPVTTSSRTSSCTSQQGSRCLRGKKLSAGCLYAASVSQEEADLRADYGALSERLEVTQLLHYFLQDLDCTLCCVPLHLLCFWLDSFNMDAVLCRV